MPRHDTRPRHQKLRNPPESIRRRGLIRVTDNVPTGCEVVIPGNLLLAFFRDELGEFLRRKLVAANDGGRA